MKNSLSNKIILYVPIFCFLSAFVMLLYCKKSMENVSVLRFKNEILMHNNYLDNRLCLSWNWNNELKDEWNLNIDKEFKEEDMKNCGLKKEHIGMFKDLYLNEYEMLHKNCIREKMHPTNIDWYK